MAQSRQACGNPPTGRKGGTDATIINFALNVVPGFGLGSYIQGDITSGIKLSIADVVGVAVLLYGNLVLEDGCSTEGEPYFCDTPEYERALIEVTVTLTTGVVILAASRIAGWIFTSNYADYADKYNKSLDEALNGNNNVSYSIEPLIVPRDGAPAVGLVFNVSF